jgi:hypothetical protein
VAAWLSLPAERRRDILRWRSVAPITPTDAAIAVGYARGCLRQTAWTWGVVPVVLVGGLYLTSLAARSDRAPWAGLTVLATFTALIVALIPSARYRKVQVRYLTMASLSDLTGPVAAVTLHWRFSRILRLTAAALLTAVLLGLEFVFWVPPLDIYSYCDGIGLALWLVWLAGSVGWPAASSHPTIGSLDAFGVTILPLGLSVPWQDITTMTVTPASVRWRLGDPACAIEATHRTPRQKRLLRRWLRRNEWSITVHSYQVREPLVEVFRAGARLRDEHNPSWQ